jgi:hypothetical protein
MTDAELISSGPRVNSGIPDATPEYIQQPFNHPDYLFEVVRFLTLTGPKAFP